jgi:hypothetical protein
MGYEEKRGRFFLSAFLLVRVWRVGSGTLGRGQGRAGMSIERA